MSRDVLAPPLMRMGGNRCYRVNIIHEDFSSQQTAIAAQQKGQSAYVEEGIWERVQHALKRQMWILQNKLKLETSGINIGDI